MAAQTFYIPNAQLGRLLGWIQAALKLQGLGGKLNGHLIKCRRAIAVALDDLAEADKLLRDEFTRYVDDGKGGKKKAPVYLRDADGNVVYKKDDMGDTIFDEDAASGERKPIPIIDPNGVALSDPEAFIREYEALLNEDAIIDIAEGGLSSAELLIVSSKGPGEIADGLEDLNDKTSEYLKPKAERDRLTSERRAKLRRFQPKDAESANGARADADVASEAEVPKPALVVDDIELSDAELNGAMDVSDNSATEHVA